MTDIRRIGDSGIHTVEGNVAGSRAARLTNEREKQRQEYESTKNKIKNDLNGGIGRIDDKFSTLSKTETAEQEFRSATKGFMTKSDYQAALTKVNEKTKFSVKKSNDEIAALEKKKELVKQVKKDEKRKKILSNLSFGMDDVEADGGEEEEDTFIMKKKKICKDPSIDTSFLPDMDRDRELQEKKSQIQSEWLEEQERMKKERLEITYSYWDGSGHRKVIEIPKGTTIGKFLEAVKQQIAAEFTTIRSTSAEDLIYIKEDLIIPQHYSFYDLIVTKARGKSGPLFHFDVHDDIRLTNDATVEKDESHPGKVVDRRWYEKNKHIFPASRWEIYDPNHERGKYTIHGGEVDKDAKPLWTN